jgi:hypothetical protein
VIDLDRLTQPRVLARALVAVSLALLTISVVGGVRLDPLPSAVEAGKALEMPPIPEPRPAAVTTVLATVERDPFRAERRRAADRYRLPGEARPAPASYAPVAHGLVGLQLHGLVTLPGGEGVAALWAPGRAARSVRVGQSYEGFRLTRVERGSAVLVGADTTVVLRLTSDLAASPR